MAVLPAPVSGLTFVGEKALWPAVAMVGLICGLVAILAATGMEAVSIVAVMGVIATSIGSLVSVAVYGKLQKVEQNTNGSMSSRDDLVHDLVDHLKKTQPIQE